MVFICILGSGHLPLEHSGSDTISIACSPSGPQRWSCLWSPGVKGGHTFSSWNNSFLRALITELISQLVPKLKFSNSSVCHQYVLPCFEVMYCWVTCSLPVFFYHSKKQKSLIFVTVSRHLFNFMLIRKTCFDSI